ncbi:hypothetical protein E5Q_00599 [Mixia osmundae IAM 14324]|uniref:GDP/GTP exchange factor Sec2 N-terminal domain-containing protein n=1 Tax=Mixia osmundae (strain CBS 9802 / IAM 14324 / JCM 22182 / KY 12970) TaxID=764103 RepID=G7DT74_MIXOS|nr:hypothetical protein E5Q_00599 [Mixia osmundae IAM 14324]
MKRGRPEHPLSGPDRLTAVDRCAACFVARPRSPELRLRATRVTQNAPAKWPSNQRLMPSVASSRDPQVRLGSGKISAISHPFAAGSRPKLPALSTDTALTDNRLPSSAAGTGTAPGYGQAITKTEPFRSKTPSETRIPYSIGEQRSTRAQSVVARSAPRSPASAGAVGQTRSLWRDWETTAPPSAPPAIPHAPKSPTASLRSLPRTASRRPPLSSRSQDAQDRDKARRDSVKSSISEPRSVRVPSRDPAPRSGHRIQEALPLPKSGSLDPDSPVDAPLGAPGRDRDVHAIPLASEATEPPRLSSFQHRPESSQGSQSASGQSSQRESSRSTSLAGSSLPTRTSRESLSSSSGRSRQPSHDTDREPSLEIDLPPWAFDARPANQTESHRARQASSSSSQRSSSRGASLASGSNARLDAFLGRTPAMPSPSMSRSESSTPSLAESLRDDRSVELEPVTPRPSQPDHKRVQSSSTNHFDLRLSTADSLDGSGPITPRPILRPATSQISATGDSAADVTIDARADIEFARRVMGNAKGADSSPTKRIAARQEQAIQAIQRLVPRYDALVEYVETLTSRQNDLEASLKIARSNVTLVEQHAETLSEALRRRDQDSRMLRSDDKPSIELERTRSGTSDTGQTTELQAPALERKDSFWRRAGKKLAGAAEDEPPRMRRTASESSNTSSAPSLTSLTEVLDPSESSVEDPSINDLCAPLSDKATTADYIARLQDIQVYMNLCRSGYNRQRQEHESLHSSHATLQQAFNALQQEHASTKAAHVKLQHAHGEMQTEVESLSETLFGEANKMVADERKAAAELQAELDTARRQIEQLSQDAAAATVIRAEYDRLKKRVGASPTPSPDRTVAGIEALRTMHSGSPGQGSLELQPPRPPFWRNISNMSGVSAVSNPASLASLVTEAHEDAMAHEENELSPGASGGARAWLAATFGRKASSTSLPMDATDSRDSLESSPAFSTSSRQDATARMQRFLSVTSEAVVARSVSQDRAAPSVQVSAAAQDHSPQFWRSGEHPSTPSPKLGSGMLRRDSEELTPEPRTLALKPLRMSRSLGDFNSLLLSPSSASLTTSPESMSIRSEAPISNYPLARKVRPPASLDALQNATRLLKQTPSLGAMTSRAAPSVPTLASLPAGLTRPSNRRTASSQSARSTGSTRSGARSPAMTRAADDLDQLMADMADLI